MKLSPIQLRAIEPEDLDWLYTIENDRSLWEVGATNVPYSKFALSNYIASSVADIYIDHQVRLIVETIAGKERVGIVDLINFDPAHLRAEVGIVIEKRFRRKGYASEVLTLLKDYALTTVHIHTLYAIVGTRNDSSMKLFEKNGFVNNGTLKDWFRREMTFEDAVVWQCLL